MSESSQNNRPQLSLLEELVNFFSHEFSGEYKDWYTSEKAKLRYMKEFLKEYSFIRCLEGQKRVWEEFEKYTFVSEAPKVRAQKEITELSEEIEKRTKALLDRYKKEEIKVT